MKKFKILFGVIMSCALAFACLAFTACGDDTFNIDTSRTATDEQLKTLLEKAESGAAIDTATGLPLSVSGKAYTVDFKLNVDVAVEQGSDSMSVKVTANMNGTMNMVKDMTGKLSMDMSMDQRIKSSGTDGSINMTAKGDLVSADKKLYAAIEGKNEIKSDGITNSTVMKEKIYVPIEEMLADFEFIFGSVANGGGTTDTEINVDEFLADLKDELSESGMDYNPQLYISGGVMKIVLDKNSYLGVAFDENDWTLSAFDVILKNIPVAELAGIGSAPVTKADSSIEFKLRKGSPVNVSAPADASEYKEAALDNIFGGIL